MPSATMIGWFTQENLLVAVRSRTGLLLLLSSTVSVHASAFSIPLFLLIYCRGLSLI